jgi:hypothetical protein
VAEVARMLQEEEKQEEQEPKKERGALEVSKRG